MTLYAPLAADRGAPPGLAALKNAVEGRLAALLPAPRHAGELGAALRYALLAPGKRLRPILTVMASWEAGNDDHRALDAGCALEMVHAASLVFDDLPAMDDARERRGQPAVHIRFGEDVALLAAITLLSTAFGTLGNMREVDAETRSRLVGILAQAVGADGLTGGQYADLRPALLKGARSAADANRRKTAALFIAAVEMAAAIRLFDEAATHRLRTCAADLGQAYQLLDDLIDSSVPNGSTASEDAGKATLLSLVGPEAAQRRLAAHVERAIDALRPMGPLAGYVRFLFQAGARIVEPV